jgi:hypothetical protein
LLGSSGSCVQVPDTELSFEFSPAMAQRKG